MDLQPNSQPNPVAGRTVSPLYLLQDNNKEEEGSPVIGGGVRKPPDIGAAGTASSTPPVRTESPTDEPAIIPDVSPVPTHPSDTDSSPVPDGQPLGQPDHLKKKQE